MTHQLSAHYKPLPPLRVAVFISGRGSNLKALIDAAKTPGYPAQIALVLSNRPEAAGIDYAKAANIPYQIINHHDFKTRRAFESVIQNSLEEHQVNFIALAGFMRLLSDNFVQHWRDRLINIHPSLLPAFKGLDTHARALEAGVYFSGCSLHYVRAALDEGPLIAQAIVPVLKDDTKETLAARVLREENKLYPKALRLIALGRLYVKDERVIFIANPNDRSDTDKIFDQSYPSSQNSLDGLPPYSLPF